MKISLEIKTVGDDGKPRFHVENELVDSPVGNEQMQAVIAKHEVGESKVHSWSIGEELPYDEGYQAAASGKDSDENPFADHYWKHNEWWLGWSAFHESE